MQDYIQKVITKTDAIFNSIPVSVYILLGCFVSLFLVNAVYEYSTQNPLNVTIDLEDVNNYGNEIKVCDSSNIVYGNNNAPICYDEDLFYSTGKLEVKK